MCSLSDSEQVARYPKNYVGSFEPNSDKMAGSYLPKQGGKKTWGRKERGKEIIGSQKTKQVGKTGSQ